MCYIINKRLEPEPMKEIKKTQYTEGLSLNQIP